MARVDGKPKMVSERYLGSAQDIEAAMAGAVLMPERTWHRAFGAVGAGGAMLTRLRGIDIVGEVGGPRRVYAGASGGPYLALARADPLVGAGATRGFAQLW